MKTALVSTCILDGPDGMGGTRFDRNVKYVNYYWPLKELLGFHDFWLLDNKSSEQNLSSFMIQCPQVKIHQFDERLERTAQHSYPYVWRGGDHLVSMMDAYDKFICIDSDAFILSKKLCHWVKNKNTGFASLWCERHQMPESSFVILNRDAFHLLIDFYIKYPWRTIDGLMVEKTMPYTEVCRDFVVDRYGETRDPVTPEMDAYLQCPVDMKMSFQGDK